MVEAAVLWVHLQKADVVVDIQVEGWTSAALTRSRRSLAIHQIYYSNTGIRLQ